MKRLILMRHAKAERHSPDGDDKSRPLHRKGHSDADKIGGFLQEMGVLPSLIIHSTAERTKETAWTVCAHLAPQPMTEGLDSLYLATSDSLLQAIRQTEATVETLMVVGHNPGIADLTLSMIGGATGDVSTAEIMAFPTAALAIIDLPVDDWSQTRSGELFRFKIAQDIL